MLDFLGKIVSFFNGLFWGIAFVIILTVGAYLGFVNAFGG